MISLIRNDNRWFDSLADLDSWVESFFTDSRGWRGTPVSAGVETSAAGFRADAFAGDDGYHVVLELPGIPKEAIEVKLENAVLTIQGEHRSGEGEDARVVRFSRSLRVGDDIDADAAEAHLENGLLTVSLPRSEAHRPRAITVN